MTPHVSKVNTEWLKARQAKYPYLAEARTSLRPEQVTTDLKVDHASAPRTPGYRTFMFKHNADRDRFVSTYSKEHGAIRLPLE